MERYSRGHGTQWKDDSPTQAAGRQDEKYQLESFKWLRT